MILRGTRRSREVRSSVPAVELAGPNSVYRERIAPDGLCHKMWRSVGLRADGSDVSGYCEKRVATLEPAAFARTRPDCG